MTRADLLLAWWHRRGLRGQARLRRLLRPDGRLTVSTKYGLSLIVDPTDYVGAFVLRHGYYESEVFEAIRPHLGPGNVFWDVGANLGLHALTAKATSPECEVVCFEPNPAMCAQILANRDANGLRIKLAPFALSDGCGVTTFHVKAGNSGMSGLSAPWRRPEDYEQTVCYRATADSLVAGGHVPQPTVMKIDVEGHEAEALAGMSGVLRDTRLRAVVFEAGRAFLEQEGNPVRRLLAAAPFRFERLSRAEPSDHDLENYVALRVDGFDSRV